MIVMILFLLLGVIGPQELLIFLIPITAAILIGNDAKKRGMNAWLWGLFVLFTLLIGIITYFIFRNQKAGRQQFRGGLNERIGRR